MNWKPIEKAVVAFATTYEGVTDVAAARRLLKEPAIIESVNESVLSKTVVSGCPLDDCEAVRVTVCDLEGGPDGDCDGLHLVLTAVRPAAPNASPLSHEAPWSPEVMELNTSPEPGRGATLDANPSTRGLFHPRGTAGSKAKPITAEGLDKLTSMENDTGSTNEK